MVPGALIGIVVWWSIGPLFLKALTTCLDSFMQNALRYSLACCVLALLQVIAIRSGRFDRSIWRKAIIPTILNVLMQTFWSASFYYAQPAIVTMLSKSSVLWVACISLALFPQERPMARTVRFWAGLAMALIGVFGVIYFKPGVSLSATWFGIILILIEACFSGLYTVSIKRYLGSAGSQAAYFVVSIYSTIALWIIALIFGHPSEALRLNAIQWSYVAISAVVALALGHTFYYATIKRVGPTIPALAVLAQPFFVLVLSSIIFGERMTPLQLGFGIVLMLGAGLAIWSRTQIPIA